MISKFIPVLFLVCSLSQFSYASKCEGYTYQEATDSYYKVHNKRSTWVDAMQTCMDEVSVFYHPLTLEEAELIKTWSTPLIEYRPENNGEPVIHVGLNDLRNEGKFETVNGIPITDVYAKWSKGNPDNYLGNENCVQMFYKTMELNDINCEYDSNGKDAFMYILPFICRKKNCVEEDTKYIYSNVTGSSYSLVLQPMNWTDAEANCTGDGAHLAIINSQEEADYLAGLVAETSTEEITEPFLWGAVHLGFHNREEKGWQTVKGELLQESGYAVWGNDQPDGQCKEKCGSMFHSGRLNDIGCESKCIFICEKTPTKV